MFLEKLEIQGFKSFADKNTLTFPGQLTAGGRGLTAIVGPNGSGKSNIADAIRWVLGEQSSKTLRAKKAEDVIFSGTGKRSQLSLAEVSLHLNNEEGDKDIGYSQLVLSRRLYRNGDSEYLINNQRTRLLDLQIMLAKANFGQKTYSVIGQGVVDGFLNMSLAERKEFFDEATGVKQYQIKRDNSLTKLKSSLDNLNQAQLLIAEIEPRLKILTKQVQRLKKRAELEGELDDLQLAYYCQAWHEINDKLVLAKQKILDLDKLGRDKEKKADHAEQELNNQRQSSGNEQEFSRLSAATNELLRTQDNLNHHLRQLQYWSELRAQIKPDSRQQELAVEQTQAAVQVETLEKELAEIRQGDDKNKISLIQQELSALTQAKDDLSRQLNRLQAWLEVKLESLGRFDLSWLNSRQTELATALIDNQNQTQATNLELDKAKLKLADWRERQTAINQRITEINQLIADLSREKNQPLERLSKQLQNSLAKLDKLDEQDGEKIKKILSEIKQELAEMLGVAKGEVQLQALTEAQQNLTDNLAEREKIVKQLSEEQLAVHRLEVESKVLIAAAQKIKQETEEIEKKITAGQADFDAKAAKADQQKLIAQIAELEEKINQKKNSLAELSLTQEKNVLARMNLERQAQTARQSLAQLTAQLNDAKLNSIRQETRLEDVQTQLTHHALTTLEFSDAGVMAEETEVKSRLADLAKKITNNQAQIDNFSRDQAERRAAMLATQKQLSGLQAEIGELNRHLNDAKIEATRHETRLEDLENEIRQDYNQLVKIQHTKPAETVELASTRERIGNLKRQLEQIGGIDTEAETEFAKTKERYDFLAREINDLTEAIGSLEKIIKGLDENIKEQFDREFKVIAQKFEEYFKILFNGGSAKLIKVSTDELEQDEAEAPDNGNEILTASLKRIKLLQKYNATGLAGVEVQATPPGKKIKSIMMLSGGERSLAAIALICAIISANPSPFVVLDEVDAALDEANSERLAKILDDLSPKTQFIVITHNRASMRRAAVLYGVTMAEDGVSKLLSLKLEEAEARVKS